MLLICWRCELNILAYEKKVEIILPLFFDKAQCLFLEVSFDYKIINYCSDDISEDYQNGPHCFVFDVVG